MLPARNTGRPGPIWKTAVLPTGLRRSGPQPKKNILRPLIFPAYDACKKGRPPQPGRPELVKKVFLTSSQTRSALLGSRLKKAACRCVHNLYANRAQISHLRHVMCFARRTRRRTKQVDISFRRARRNSTRFFDRMRPPQPGRPSFFVCKLRLGRKPACRITSAR